MAVKLIMSPRYTQCGGLALEWTLESYLIVLAAGLCSAPVV